MVHLNAKGEKSRARIPKDFPLSVHQGRGLWCKSIRGKRVYFEKVDTDPDGRISLEQWLKWKDELIAGRPKPSRDSKSQAGLTVEDLCNHFLEWKESEEITRRHFEELQATCKLFAETVGRTLLVSALKPLDFDKFNKALKTRYGLNSRAKRVIQIRSVFNFAVEDELIPHLPAYGVRNKPPSAKALREHRLAKGDQSYGREDVIKLLTVADPNLRAWVLLGIQAGFSGADCRELPLKAFEPKSTWLDYPRAKTATPRRIPLWPETHEALEACIEFRRNHASDKLFISSRGNEYSQQSPGGWRVAALFKLLCKRAGVECKGFHSLRRTFQTQAEECLDFVAVRSIMGHSSGEGDMSARYRQRITDERLTRVTQTVYEWLKPWEAAQ